MSYRQKWSLSQDPACRDSLVPRAGWGRQWRAAFRRAHAGNPAENGPRWLSV